ncbi:hypothetical protein E3N88_31537 [Mikania micrantha]|uniref:BHLH domain-containing protein n=1 Tax=Mikania micrantha TaxID=192012 RepID=A0A5N6MQ64_9ASTR|nr:hypothetical protein E3N88_31537 [Mikania micrantha]
MPEIQLGAHTIRSHGVKVARTHMHDWLVLLFLVVIEVILNVIEPFHCFVGSNMMDDLKYPLQENTMPLWAVPVDILITGVLIDVIKDVGRPRPDFFWHCFPDDKGVFDTVTSKVMCTRLKSIIKGGHKGSFAGLGFLSWYMARKIRVFDRRDHVKKYMQKGDDDYQLQQQLLSLAQLEELPDLSVTTNLFNSTLAYNSTSYCSDCPSFGDIVKVLSQVELPSPSPEPMTSSCNLMIRFQQGQSSGIKKDDGTEFGKVEREEEHRAQASRAAEQRRRSRYQEKLRHIKELIPGCNKRDQASILDDGIEYIKYLETQLQMIEYMRSASSMTTHGFYMSPWNQLPEPYLAPYHLMMRPAIMNDYCSYFTPRIPPFFSYFNPLAATLLPTPQPAAATNNINAAATNASQVAGSIYSHYPYHHNRSN